MLANLVYYLVIIDYALLSMIVISESRKKKRFEIKSKKKTARSNKEFTDDSDTDVRKSGTLFCFR